MDNQVLYLTTIGRRTGLPREIEIWFVVRCERLYLFAETREAAGWVKNIGRNPKVKVRIGKWRTDATARVPDRHTDAGSFFDPEETIRPHPHEDRGEATFDRSCPWGSVASTRGGGRSYTNQHAMRIKQH